MEDNVDNQAADQLVQLTGGNKTISLEDTETQSQVESIPNLQNAQCGEKVSDRDEGNTSFVEHIHSGVTRRSPHRSFSGIGKLVGCSDYSDTDGLYNDDWVKVISEMIKQDHVERTDNISERSDQTVNLGTWESQKRERNGLPHRQAVHVVDDQQGKAKTYSGEQLLTINGQRGHQVCAINNQHNPSNATKDSPSTDRRFLQEKKKQIECETSYMSNNNSNQISIPNIEDSTGHNHPLISQVQRRLPSRTGEKRIPIGKGATALLGDQGLAHQREFGCGANSQLSVQQTLNSSRQEYECYMEQEQQYRDIQMARHLQDQFDAEVAENTQLLQEIAGGGSTDSNNSQSPLVGAQGITLDQPINTLNKSGFQTKSDAELAEEMQMQELIAVGGSTNSKNSQSPQVGAQAFTPDQPIHFPNKVRLQEQSDAEIAETMQLREFAGGGSSGFNGRQSSLVGAQGITPNQPFCIQNEIGMQAKTDAELAEEMQMEELITYSRHTPVREARRQIRNFEQQTPHPYTDRMIHRNRPVRDTLERLTQHRRRQAPHDTLNGRHPSPRYGDNSLQPQDWYGPPDLDLNDYEAVLALTEMVGDAKQAGLSAARLAALQTLTLQPGDVGNTTQEKSKECQICFDKYEAGDVVCPLPCDHVFHKNCITPWLQEKDTCPLCRKVI